MFVISLAQFKESGVVYNFFNFLVLRIMTIKVFSEKTLSQALQKNNKTVI